MGIVDQSVGSIREKLQAASPCPPERARPGLRAPAAVRSLLTRGSCSWSPRLPPNPPGTKSLGAETPWWGLPCALAGMS